MNSSVHMEQVMGPVPMDGRLRQQHHNVMASATSRCWCGEPMKPAPPVTKILIACLPFFWCCEGLTGKLEGCAERRRPR